MTFPTLTLTGPGERPGGRRWHRVGAIVALVAVLFGLAAALASPARATGDDPEDLSLYAVGSSLTSFFASTIKPDSKVELSDDWEKILGSPATGGAVLGYADKDLNPIEWLIAQATSSSQSIEYSTLSVEGVRQYAEFGATLSALGVDSQSGGFGSNMIRLLGGGILFVGVLISGLVDWVFSAALQMMIWMNPFQWLINAVESYSPTMADGMVQGGVTESGGLFSGLASYVSGIYSTVRSLSWAVIVPLFIMSAALFVLLGKSKGGWFHKLVVRLLFIGIGVPLLGSMYTNSLNAMSDSLKGGDTGVAKVIASTYVDFEAWAQHSRLAVPKGATIEWDREKNSPTDKAVASIQDTARAINVMSYPEFEGMGSLMTAGDEIDWTRIKRSKSDSTAMEDENRARARAVSMLSRYMSHETFDSSTFAGSIQGGLTGPGAPSGAESWFSSLRGDKIPDDVADNPLLTTAGGLKATVDGSTVKFTSSADSRQASCAGSTSQACSMSVMGMYNYLNTAFDSKSMTVYSRAKGSSAAVIKSHDSVTLVGTGATSLIYWLSAVTLVAAFVIVGIGYAASMMFGNISKGIKVLTAVPFAMMGALGAITKVIVFTAVMLVEALATIFVYKIVQELLLAMPRIFNNAMVWVLDLVGLADKPGFSLFVNQGIIVTMIVVVIMFTIVSLRVRRAVITALSEAAKKIVEAMVGVSAGGAGGGGGRLGNLAASAAGGAGSAAMHNRMGGKGAAVPAAAGAAAGAGGAQAGAAAGAEGANGQAGAPDAPGTQPGSGGAVAGGSGPGGTSGGPVGGASRAVDSSDQQLGEKVATDGLTMDPGAAGAAKGAPAATAAGTGAAGAGAGATKVVAAGATAGGAGASAAGVVAGAAASKAGAKGEAGAKGAPGQNGQSQAGGSGVSSESVSTSTVATDGDAMDSAFEAGAGDFAERQALDKRRAQAASQTGEAAVLAGRGAARAAAGDELGAVQDVTSAAGKAQSAQQQRAQVKAERRALNDDPARMNTRSGSAPQRQSGGGSAPDRQSGGRRPAPRPRPSQPAPNKPSQARSGGGAGGTQRTVVRRTLPGDQGPGDSSV